MIVDIAQVLQLPAEEKLQIIDELWDSIGPGDSSIPAHVFDELDRRRASHLQRPQAASTWEQIIERLAQHDD